MSVGPRGASVTLGGARGPALNLGIPGTGFSFRQQLTPTEPNAPRLPASERHDEAPPPPAGTEIKSADVSEVTSEGLDELKALYAQVVSERETLRESMAATASRLSRAEARLRRARNWFFKLFIGGKAEDRAAVVEREAAGLRALEARLEGAFIDADFGLHEAAQAAFREVVAAFKEIAACARLWDVTSSRHQDRRATRSSVSTVVERAPVAFSVSDADDVIQTSESILRLGNANGPDVLVYPAFILLRSARDLAFVDLREVDVQFAGIRFNEDEAVPQDSQVVGHNWLKANKDGSPDRRFANNRQIPVALYGELSLTSPEGVNESYLLSDHAKAERFADALRAYQKKLPALVREPAPFAGKAVAYLSKARASTPDQVSATFARFSELLQADLAAAQGSASLDEVEGLLTGAGEVIPAVRAFLRRSPAAAQVQALSEGFARVVATLVASVRTGLANGRGAAQGDDVARVDKLIEKADAVLAAAGASPTVAA